MAPARGMINFEKVLDFVQFVELVHDGHYKHDPSVERIRQRLQEGKTHQTLKTQRKLYTMWETGMADGIVCSMRRDSSMSSEVKNFNSFIVSLASKFGGMGKIPTLKMLDSSSIGDIKSYLRKDFADVFVGGYKKTSSKVLPFVVFKTSERDIEDKFWMDFEMGEEV